MCIDGPPHTHTHTLVHTSDKACRCFAETSESEGLVIIPISNLSACGSSQMTQQSTMATTQNEGGLQVKSLSLRLRTPLER